MNVIIVEDEIIATRKLETMLKRLRPGLEVLAKLESVKEAVNWIKQGIDADLAFFDIQLADDVSFEIFSQCRVNFPVIFVTAFDEYLLRAFEQNTIHYLLKPVTEIKLKEALEKYDRVTAHFGKLSRPVNQAESGNRILVRKGLNFVPLSIDNIAYIFSEHKISFVKDHHDVVYIADQSLAELERKLEPMGFFRANRQYLVHLGAINKFRSIEQSKIRLDLFPPTKEDVIIGKENAGLFRKWIKERI